MVGWFMWVGMGWLSGLCGGSGGASGLGGQVEWLRWW